MRLSQDAAYIHLEDIAINIESVRDRANEMLWDSRDHMVGAGWDEPRWLDSIGQSLVDCANEALECIEGLDRWHEKVWAHVEGGKAIALRSIKHAYKRLAKAEECL